MSAAPIMSAQAGASKRRWRARLVAAFAASAAFAAAGAASAQSEPAQLAARTVRVYAAPEADQGVAVDRRYFYAVDNAVIAKYDRDSGASAGRWSGPADGPIRHLNACLARAELLYCANSNYPHTPMASSIEIFDARTLRHRRSHGLGLAEEGSLTWIDRIDGGWIAGFAHYDGNGGVGFKDHRFSSVVTFDRHWRRTGGWAFPDSVLERMAPHAASGGAIGPDGLLYVMGHDRPEMYVLAAPRMGPALVHVATIALEAEGQAFSFSPTGAREVFTVDRRQGRVLAHALPEVSLGGYVNALPLR